MKLKLHTLFFGFMLLFGTANAQTIAESYVPLTITGFNHDVIANGVGPSSGSTTIGVDNAGIAFLSTDFANGIRVAPTTALPVGGLLTSQLNASIKYQLAPYTGNNALRLQATNDTGELMLTGVPASAQSTKALNIISTGGSGAVNFSYVVTFSDNTTQSGTGSAGDWVGGTGTIAYSNFGRVSRFDDVITTTFGTPKMFQTTVTIDADKQTKTVSKISFTKTSTTEGTLNVFAVTATLGVCVAPPTPQADSRSFCKSATVADLAARGITTGATVNWYNSPTSTTPLAATDALTTGTYYLTQKMGTCESNKWSINVVVTDLTAPAAAALQSFCTYATVSEIVKTGAAGVTYHYYKSSDLTKEVGFYEELVSGTSYTITQSLGNCISPSTEVTVTVNNTDAPAVLSQSFCKSATVANLQATATTGATVKWYATANATTSLETTAALTPGIYYATQTIAGCESRKKAFEVVIHATPPLVEGDAEQTFATGETIADLDITTTGNYTAKWYTKNTAGAYVEVPTTTALVDGTTYYVQQNSATCPSDYYAITVKESNVANTGSFKFKNLVVYPNPAVSAVTITNSDIINNVRVTNLLGQTIINVVVNSTAVPINIEQLASGTYILQVQSGNNTATVKLIKQ
jgi:hypothetical protein